MRSTEAEVEISREEEDGEKWWVIAWCTVKPVCIVFIVTMVVLFRGSVEKLATT